MRPGMSERAGRPQELLELRLITQQSPNEQLTTRTSSCPSRFFTNTESWHETASVQKLRRLMTFISTLMILWYGCRDDLCGVLRHKHGGSSCSTVDPRVLRRLGQYKHAEHWFREVQQNLRGNTGQFRVCLGWITWSTRSRDRRETRAIGQCYRSTGHTFLPIF